MRIAILTPTLHGFSGIDRVVEIQAKHFLAQGNPVTIYTLDASLAVKDADIVVLGTPKNSLLQRIYRLIFFLDIVKIISTVRSLKNEDVIHCHFYPMNILALFAKIFYKKKYIYHNYGVPPAESFTTWTEKIYITVFRTCNNLTARYADTIISISKYLADVFEKETGKKSGVEYIKINSKRFHPDVNGSKIRRKYSIHEDPLIVYIGRISPHKGIHMLMEAVNKARKTIPNLHLMIIGKQTFPAYSKRLMLFKHPKTHFTGFVPDADLPDIYGACTIYATCTLWEGYDMPVAEAQACGKPVVAFDIGPHKEIIDSRGILVPAKNIDRFSEAIIKQINSEIHDTN